MGFGFLVLKDVERANGTWYLQPSLHCDVTNSSLVGWPSMESGTKFLGDTKWIMGRKKRGEQVVLFPFFFYPRPRARRLSYRSTLASGFTRITANRKLQLAVRRSQFLVASVSNFS